MNNFSTVHAIFAQISSIGAACRKKLKYLNEITKNSFQWALFFKTPPKGTSSHNTLLNNFSPIQSILTNSIPIDSAQQAENT
jgi:hypothetical protein